MKKTGLILLAIVLVIAAYNFLSSPEPGERTRRQLASGEVVGFEPGNGTYAWLGIPFARPPLGDLRWRAPRPVEPWEGVLEALEYSSMCSQILPFGWIPFPVDPGNEDCLYLNVWTPELGPAELETTRLPVMVWIHGGANTMGGSFAAEPSRFAARENVIVVSIQYRLGLLGWFSHPALRETASEPLDASSNFALLDMVAALEWVQDNIAGFGGDPDKVTIFGQSAGAFDVIALLAAPQASGLFHRAISQSGNLNTIPRDSAEHYAGDASPGLPYSFREYVSKLLLADGLASDRDEARQVQDGMGARELADYLRAKPVNELFGSVDRRGSLGYFTPTNIRDGIVLPQAPLLEVFSDPARYNSVPVILGSNRDEYKFFLSSSPELVERKFGLFPQIRDSDEYRRITRYFSDQWQAVGVSEPARTLSRSQPGKVYAYVFDWAEQPTRWGVDEARLYGASHGVEVVFLFGADAVSSLPGYARASDQTSWNAVSDAMLTYWANFARNGEPGGGGQSALARWTPWREEGARKLVINSPRAGGMRMTGETVFVADLKQRLLDDGAIESTRGRCELYARLFYYALSREFWSEEEYRELGCADFPVEAFTGII